MSDTARTPAPHPTPDPATARPIPTTMTSAVVDRWGPPEQVVELREVPMPSLGPEDVLVRVGAGSINAADWIFVSGIPGFARIALGLRRPKRSRPGVDVAGTVAALGSRVTSLAVGDRLFGQAEDGGAYAEYVAMPAASLVRSPARLDDAETSTLGIAALTALQGLRDWGRLRPGQRVLINGASGGVGTFAIQVARALGAGHITAVCSTRNVEAARALGADRVLDYTREDVTALTDRFDLLFDNAGVWPLRACRRLLAPAGVYVSVTAPKGRWLRPLPRMAAIAVYFAAVRQPHAVSRVAKTDMDDLRELARLCQEGAITPVIEKRWPLAEVAEALRVQGEGHARAKSVVVP